MAKYDISLLPELERGVEEQVRLTCHTSCTRHPRQRPASGTCL